jgi:hypothetical protein
MENDEEKCSFYNLCERLGTNMSACSNAAAPKHKVMEQMRHTYNGDAQLIRLALIEQDIDRLRACMTSVLKLLT